LSAKNKANSVLLPIQNEYPVCFNEHPVKTLNESDKKPQKFLKTILRSFFNEVCVSIEELSGKILNQFHDKVPPLK
jgi:hypothetical protein